MKIIEYLVSWEEGKNTKNEIYQNREDADICVRILLKKNMEDNQISNIKLKRRGVVYSKWKKVIKE